jgi:hypothetical protein
MTEDDAEADIHNLIVPRYKNFNGDTMPSEVYQNNAWLLDDKLAPHKNLCTSSGSGRLPRQWYKAVM